MITISRRRGPWTPSTRSSSMSEVAHGPGDQGDRPVVPRGWAIASGTSAEDLVGAHDADVQVGKSVAPRLASRRARSSRSRRSRTAQPVTTPSIIVSRRSSSTAATVRSGSLGAGDGRAVVGGVAPPNRWTVARAAQRRAARCTAARDTASGPGPPAPGEDVSPRAHATSPGTTASGTSGISRDRRPPRERQRATAGPRPRGRAAARARSAGARRTPAATSRIATPSGSRATSPRGSRARAGARARDGMSILTGQTS